MEKPFLEMSQAYYRGKLILKRYIQIHVMLCYASDLKHSWGWCCCWPSVSEKEHCWAGLFNK